MKNIEQIDIIKKKLEKRKIDFDLNMELAKCYEQNEEYIEAIKIYSFLEPIKEHRIDLIEETKRCLYKLQSKSKNGFKEGLEAISYMSSPLNIFPIYWRFYFDNNGQLTFNEELFIFRYLNKGIEEYNPFICANNSGYEGVMYKTYDILNKSQNGKMHFNVKAEIIESKLALRSCYKLNNKKMVLPIACTKSNQKIEFTFKDTKKSKVLVPYEYSFIRLDEDVQISSKNNIILGKPIELSHSSKRKKLVVDIFIDTLSYNYIKSNNFLYTKEIYNFFKQGIIFSNNYSIGEYTRPVVSGIRTGLYTYNNQMFNDKVNTKISKDIKLTAELLREMGYYTAEFSGDTGQPAGDLLRGISRAVVQSGHHYRAHEIVNDAIDHIDAFKECDNYIRLSILDIHRAIEEDINRNIQTQVSTKIEDIFEKSTGSNSVFQKGSNEKIQEYKTSLIKVDRALGVLFKYIKENYNEDEYLVTLVSDHGAMLLDEDEFLLKDVHTNTALMARGGSIPKIGEVKDEMTSVIDLYSIYYNLVEDKGIHKIDSKMPKILGGIGREYTISESLYPGQTYKICIRNMQYEFRLETENLTTYDGLVEINKYKCKLFDRKKRCEVLNEEIKEQFIEIFKNLNKKG